MRNVESLYVTRTYGGCLEGGYDTHNRYMGRVIKEQAKRLWGDHRPVHVFEPEGGMAAFKEALPEYTYYALLDEMSFGTSFGPDDYDGSHLVVVWFSTMPVGEVQYDLDELVTDTLWREKSKGYQI